MCDASRTLADTPVAAIAAQHACAAAPLALYHHLVGVKRPAACSITWAVLKRVSSSNGLPISCRPSGRPLWSTTAGNGDARQAGHVDRHREDVVEVHLDRIGCEILVGDAEGGGRRGRRQDRVDAGVEGQFEVALDQRANLLGAAGSRRRSSRPKARRCRS